MQDDFRAISKAILPYQNNASHVRLRVFCFVLDTARIII